MARTHTHFTDESGNCILDDTSYCRDRMVVTSEILFSQGTSHRLVLLSDAFLRQCWEMAKGGGNASCDFFFGGGMYYRVRALWRHQKVGSVWSVPISSEENDWNRRGGWETYHRWGSPNRFGGGVLWYVFPFPEFSTPLCCS